MVTGIGYGHTDEYKLITTENVNKWCTRNYYKYSFCVQGWIANRNNNIIVASAAPVSTKTYLGKMIIKVSIIFLISNADWLMQIFIYPNSIFSTIRTNVHLGKMTYKLLLFFFLSANVD